MKRFLFGVVIGGLLGTGFGAALMVFFYPFIFLSGIVAEETLHDVEAKTLRAGGSFIHANPSDPIHYGMGKVSLYYGTVRLESDFEVGPGPKYKVLLHTAKGIRKSGDVTAARSIDLGDLRAFKGSQNYTVPADVKLDDYQSVVIWCEAFGVLISPAELMFR